MKEDDVFAFVLMPFHDNFNDIYRLGIKETANAVGIKAERVDEQIFREGMLDRIYRQIDVSDIVIADMSDQNANVFYEVGYAHGREKLCILLTKDAADIPFDLKHYRHIVYGNSIDNLRKLLTEELKWAKTYIETARNSQVKVSISDQSGNLEKTKYSAKGVIDFKIDLHNDTGSTSPEIEAMYFYSSNGWELKQDGKDCPSTCSDIPDFSKRHFISPPVRKLHKNTWAQLKFSATKYLALSRKGEVLKSSYRVTGRSVLRLVTQNGNFDYELSIDTECDEIPF